MTRISRLVLGVALLGSIPSATQAQTTESLGEVSGRLKTGDMVYVAAGGPAVKGSLVEISSSSLAVLVDGRRRDFSVADVSRVQREKRATKLGALIGMGAGGVGLAATMVASVERTCGPVRGGPHACDDEWGSQTIAMIFGGIGAGIGAGAGAGVGSLFKRRETVFAKHAGDVMVRPIVDRSRKGLAVSIGF